MKILNFMILLMTFLLISCSKNENVTPNNPIVDDTTTIIDTSPEKKVVNELTFFENQGIFSGSTYIRDIRYQGQLVFKKVNDLNKYSVKIPGLILAKDWSGKERELEFEYLRKEENSYETKYFYKVYTSYDIYRKEIRDLSYDNSGFMIRHIKNTNKIECKILLAANTDYLIKGQYYSTLDSRYTY